MKKIKYFMLNRRISKYYYTTEPACSQRLSNNSKPKFTDIQVTTIYLYGIILGFQTKKAVYNFAIRHLLKYCKHMPTYKQFCVRINQLAPVFAELFTLGITEKKVTTKTHISDSMPAVVAKGSRSSRAKTAEEICDKGYCKSKKMWYYGVKLHILAEERAHKMPIPRISIISPASEHDLPAGKRMLENAEDTEVFADKAYIDNAWGYDLQLRYVSLNVPFKERSKKLLPLDDGECAWNAEVSRRRQPIESLFSHISALTGIQDAHFVRSYHGLLAFIWARLAILALFYW